MSASAPGKIILLGEHAVVYGKPAIAIPVPSVQTTVSVSNHPGSLHIRSAALGLNADLNDIETAHPIRAMFDVIFAQLKINPQGLWIEVDSSIPVASGLGSGAALSAATIKALAQHFELQLSLDQINTICFETEKIFHGKPSGVDNTVITYNQPVYYQSGMAVEPLEIRGEFHFLIANTGVQASTKEVVADVRRLTEVDPNAFQIIEHVGKIVELGRIAIQTGDEHALGGLMDKAHLELQMLTVSCSELDVLVKASKDLGAIGAKLSGAGRGGNMIALAKVEDTKKISAGLLRAGAKNVIVTTLRGA